MNKSEELKKKVVLGGAIFSLAENDCYVSTKCEHHLNRSRNCFSPQKGGHYNHFFVKTEMAMVHLRRIFLKGEANDLNFILFSTSGVHGTYTTIEEAEKVLKTAPIELDEEEQDCAIITFVIIQPRLCTLHYGNCEPKSLEDIEYLKKLRQSSWDIVKEIGKN